MAIIRYRPGNVFTPTWNPFRELEDVTSRLRGMFEDDQSLRRWEQFTPPVSVMETKDELVLTAELPGLAEEDVQIELENNVLCISGEKRTEREESEENRYHVWERRYGSFQRSFTLPGTVRRDEITAEFKNGILEVHMPKMPEAKGRKINIKASTS